MRWLVFALFSLLFVAAATLPLAASDKGAESQSPDNDHSENRPLTDVNSTNGTIYGSTVSTSGARLEGAIVTLTDEATGTAYEVTSGEMGMFRMTGLSPGVYEVQAILAGFQSASIPKVSLQAGQRIAVNILMQQAFSIEEYVTVIGKAPASSLEFAEIRESSARDLGEALTKRAGLWRVRKGGIANDVVLRGFQGRDLNVLIDGQRVYGACPNNMDPAAFHADFAEVDRVDVAKGPFDVKNEGGLGGSVNVVTRKPRDSFHARGNLTVGSFGFLNPSAMISYGGDRFSALAGFSYRSSNPYSDGSGKRFTELTNYLEGALEKKAFEIGTFWGKVGLSPFPRHQVQLSYARQEAESLLYPYLRMDAEFDDADRIGFRWEAERLSDTVTGFLVQAYYSQVAHWMTDRFRTTSATGSRGYSMATLADTRTAGGKVETQIWRDWTFGFEGYQRFWGAYTEMAGMNYKPQFSLPDVDMTSFGFYGEYQKPISERLTLSAGGRIDRVSSLADKEKANTNLYRAYHGTESTSAIDAFPSGYGRLDYRAGPGVNLTIGLGTAVQVPEPSERYFALKRMGSDWVGNPLLLPSRNTGIEGSFSLERAGVFFATDLFVNWIDNVVTLYDQPLVNEVPGVSNRQARTYANTNAQIRGAELNVVVPLEDRLFLSADLSYVRGTKKTRPDIGLLSNNLAEIPPLRVRVNLRFDQGRFFGAAEGVFSSAQHNTDSDLYEEETPSYAVMNLTAGFRQGRIDLTAGVGNLFNRTYSEHLSYQRDPFRSGIRVTEPGRNVFLNLSIDF